MNTIGEWLDDTRDIIFTVAGCFLAVTILALVL
jgi:hypothetical protein